MEVGGHDHISDVRYHSKGASTLSLL